MKLNPNEKIAREIIGAPLFDEIVLGKAVEDINWAPPTAETGEQMERSRRIEVVVRLVAVSFDEELASRVRSVLEGNDLPVDDGGRGDERIIARAPKKSPVFGSMLIPPELRR